ncbi:zinc finger CCCH-type antiviral protein 1 isoform X2 [Antechinus flavipes]|uniref:zinc finger CCCH-type antiviral protein 1 isoform X2 n=1 Tax=Antechinus flavipes TaxID=38775 RepID=UPI002235F5BD|nr:zinc finger CCCH-type antiviral protein 1 isoform X2 [Antechinus flavipes]
MADPAVCGFLTGLLCAQGGRLALRELLGLIELSEGQLLEVLSEAGPERFVLLDQGPDAGPLVLATTPVRVCRRVTCRGACEALHLCKLNLLDRCRRESNYCKYSHDIHSEKNIKILKKHDISVLSKNELAVLLLQSDPFFLPDICKYYKGENRKDSCTNTECMKLHICEHFIEGKCGYVHCNRSHDLMDTKVLELLKEEGLTIPVIRNIQDICDQKHIRSKKRIPRRRDKSDQRNARHRSQSRNRYFFGTQELPTSPSASVETLHIPEPDKMSPAPLPSSEGKVNERGAPENNSSLRQDAVQSVSASTKTVSIQQASQLGTNLSRREGQYGTQDGTQRAASTSTPGPAAPGPAAPGPAAPGPATPGPAAPAEDSHHFRRVKVLFGNDADSRSDPAPQTTRKSESTSSSNSTSAGNDCEGQKAHPSLTPNKTVDMWDKKSSAVVFSKYKPSTNVKKQEFPSKRQDNQSTLVNAQLAKTATLKEQKTPAANNLVTSDHHDMRLETLHEKMQRWESSAHKVDATTQNLERIYRNDKEEPQKGQVCPRDKAAVAHVRPKTPSASDVPQSGIKKDGLAQSSLPTASDLKKTAAFLRKQVIQMQDSIGSPTGSVSASPSSQTLATLGINRSRAVSPSKSTNAEDFRARVLNIIPSGMENYDSIKICLDYLNGDCKLQECCKDVHFYLPYRWQKCISNVWEDLTDMEEIEKAYCNPDISRSHGIDFQEMLLDLYPVRRLSTPSTIQNSTCALSTKWHWYWKNELNHWIEYGKEEDSELTSEDLELFFLVCPQTFLSPHHKYKLNFNEMTQTNIASGTTREVRRRPQFVSSVTVYWNQKRTNQSREQNTKESFNFPSSWNQMDLSERKYEIPSSSAACERNCSLVENTHNESRSTQACGKIQKLISMWEILQFTQVHKEENHKISGEAKTTDSDSSENETDLK